MAAGARAVVDLHARAFNAHDMDTLAAGVLPGAPVYRDGRLLGQGPLAARRLLSNEYGRGAAAGTVVELDTGERVLVEWSDAERGGEPVGVLRFSTEGLRIGSIHAEHDAGVVRQLVASGRRHR